jgi:hypothetical protein
LGASEYINLPGGKSIYSKDFFREQGVDLKFLKVDDFIYDQGSEFYTPFLSVLDVLFHLGMSGTSKSYVNQYSTE